MRPTRSLPLLAALLALPVLAHADWTANGVRICGASGNQRDPDVTTDGHAAILAWDDQRAGTGLSDIYASRVWPTGFVASGWPTDGLLVCGAAGAQTNPRLASDGAGGAFIVWDDARNGSANLDVYVQRVTAEGTIAPGWPVNGLALCAAANNQTSPLVAADGATGAYVVWVDERAGAAAGSDLYAAHVLASGALAPGWSADGNAVCTAANVQILPTFASDAAGGAVVAWVDRRTGTEYDLYAQRLAAGGVAWAANGVSVSKAPGDQTTPSIAADDAGGAYVAWNDFRDGTGHVYGQHLDGSGAPVSGWDGDGNALCLAAGSQYAPVAAADGAGGLYAAWEDYRASGDIYATRVGSGGARVAGWLAEGNAVCAAAGLQTAPLLVGDGAGGVYACWSDQRNPTPVLDDVYAQHLNGDATVAGGWLADGNAVCSTSGFQNFPRLSSDGFGGAYATWQDRRNNQHLDIYLSRFGPAGPAVADAPALAPRAGLALRGANPFRGEARLHLVTTREGVARVDVLDVGGRRVRTLLDGALAPGAHELAWDGRDDAGRPLPAGVWFVRARDADVDARLKLVRVE